MAQNIPESVIAEETAKVTASLAAVKRDADGKLIDPAAPVPAPKLDKDGKPIVEQAPAYQPVVESLGSQEMPGADRAAAFSQLRSVPGISDAVIAEIRDGSPMGQTEVAQARELKDRLMSNKEWTKRYNDGDRDCLGQMLLINTILSSRVVSDDEIRVLRAKKA